MAKFFAVKIIFGNYFTWCAKFKVPTNRNTEFVLTIELSVDGVFEESSGPKVNQFELSGLEVHQDVLVLDVSVHNTHFVDLGHCADDLAEKVSGQRFWKGTLLRDVVEEVHDRIWTLHDDDERVWLLVEVQKLDDAVDVVHFCHQADFHRDHAPVQLKVQKVSTALNF